MNAMKLMIILSLITGLVGCIPSLNPLYKDKDLVYRSELIGTWTDSTSKETWTFEKQDSLEYKLTHSEGKGNVFFIGHLVKIGHANYFDIYPDELKSEDYLYKLHLFPVHTFSKIKIAKDQLVIEMFNPTWFEESLKNKKFAIDHMTSTEGNLLVTASTEDLQNFVMHHENDTLAFQEPLNLIRKK